MVEMNQGGVDGWGTEEDSNSLPQAAKAAENSGKGIVESKGKVMGGGFWGDEPSSTIATDAGMSH